MDLFAAGFNAWNQLCFVPRSGDVAEPKDLSTFTKVLDDDHLERPRAGLYYTLVRGRARYYRAGIGVETASDEDIQRNYQACRAGNGLTLIFDGPISAENTGMRLGPNKHVLTVHPCYDDFVSKSNPTSWPCDSQVREVASFAAGFIILYQNGKVATMGDPRYQDCLAREITSDEPADQPGFVPDLINLGEPIEHVTAGDGGKDVQDVALGDSHAIALTTDGTVYVIGRNDNGQLGLRQGVDMVAKTWTKVKLGVPDDCQVVGVAAGPKSSFILTAQKT
ncbi:hypothetical protein MAC_01799 [Metarhizium acridum CQMa 102]|uniref:Uncharacterized protein n=1 Tax=Metarhizium acridum (strain CQMa 102) TaxID=655827 RepID=E9DW01_METAQ|nr:uncharacterized protein MAC_01799 [Metarhizium acridum CQMa 102]EFY92198.1 hypothetical protein MAC_01799 [Metarhizium acridum CQMa 102]